MKLLTSKEICNIAHADIDDTLKIIIKPFNLNSLKNNGYELHAGNAITIEHANFREADMITPNGYLMSPRFIYTLKVIEYTQEQGVIPCVTGAGVVNATKTQKSKGHYILRIAPTTPYILYPNDVVATIRYYTVDNALCNKLKEKNKHDETMDAILQNFEDTANIEIKPSGLSVLKPQTINQKSH